ncbi:MAG: histidinol-phosphate transaminase, partial [Nitriliruptoraceae bacterium]
MSGHQSSSVDTVASASAVGPPPGMRVRLSSNESPIGPSPTAIEAAGRALAQGHRYPDDQSEVLRGALAAEYGRDEREVAVGNGSAALLMDAIAAVGAGGDVLAFERSFIVYRLAAANVSARYVEVPTGPPPSVAGPGYIRDPERLLDAVGARTRAVVLDNPGNPTGTHLAPDDLRELVTSIPEYLTVIIDEAYRHFAVDDVDYATVEELGIDHPRLVVLDTFSKAHALAGLRIGVVRGPAELVGHFDARRPRFNVTAPAQAAALASLADRDHLAEVVAVTRAGRRRMADVLADAGVIYTDSRANFLTIELGEAAGPTIAAFAQRGIGVRDLGAYG